MTAEKETKYVYRLPPCPDFDVERVESWLEDLAKEGLLLDREGLFFGFFTFIRTAPQTVRYRLEPSLKAQSFWDSNPGEPKEDLLILSEEMGWEFVTKYGHFFIYRCFDPSAPELHTDVEIQRYTLNALKKQMRNAFFTDVILLLLYAAFGVLGYPMGLCIAIGTPAAIAFILFFLWQLLRPLAAIRHLKKLLRTDIPRHGKDWKTNRKIHFTAKLLSLCLSVFLAFSLIGAWIGDSEREIPIADFEKDPPFATMADLLPGGTYEERGLGYSNTVKEWSDLLFPVNMEWDELAEVTSNDGTSLYGSMDITYHEARSPVLARQLAREFILYGREHPFAPLPEVEESKIGDVTIYRFTGKYHYRTAVLVCGATVVQGNFLVDESGENLIEYTWIQRMAERLSDT